MVTDIISAYGPRITDRPPLMSAEERALKLKEVELRQEKRRTEKELKKIAIAKQTQDLRNANHRFRNRQNEVEEAGIVQQ
jgi:hypothetical protein